jgi:hypothetical protein
MKILGSSLACDACFSPGTNPPLLIQPPPAPQPAPEPHSGQAVKEANHKGHEGTQRVRAIFIFDSLRSVDAPDVSIVRAAAVYYATIRMAPGMAHRDTQYCRERLDRVEARLS